MMSHLYLMTKSLQYYFDLVMILTQKEIKIRYKNSFLGYLWSLANPLFFAMIYYLAFKTVMRVDIKDYTLFLICGLFPWQWLSNSINNNLFAFIGNAQIIKKTNFPRSVIPLSNILMEGFNFTLSIPVIFFFLWFYQVPLTWDHILYMPFIMLGQVLLTYGISLFFATINLFFRDIERFVQLGLMMLFYVTPILYQAHMIPDRYKWLIEWNPFARLIIVWRDLLLHNTFRLWPLLEVYGFAVISIVIGFFTFNKLKYRFAEVL